MGLATFGIALYHLAQRAIPPGLHPVAVVLLVYLFAASATVALLLLSPGGPAGFFAHKLFHPSVVLLAIACVAIELGFLWIYRSGWKMAVVPLVANCSVTVILAIVGWLYFREGVTPRQGLGMLLSVCGLWLMSRSH
jgi:drug/metabolite transporter (DMT)-like permease